MEDINKSFGQIGQEVINSQAVPAPVGGDQAMLEKAMAVAQTPGAFQKPLEELTQMAGMTLPTPELLQAYQGMDETQRMELFKAMALSFMQ